MTEQAATHHAQQPPQYDPIERLHARLDDVFDELASLNKQLAVTSERCAPCQLAIKQHAATIYGNGHPGLTARINALEQGRVDTLSVKSVITLLGAVGALAGSIAGAVGGLVAALVK